MWGSHPGSASRCDYKELSSVGPSLSKCPEPQPSDPRPTACTACLRISIHGMGISQALSPVIYKGHCLTTSLAL